MKKESLKLFVGGYYDDRIFQGEEEKTPFNKDINTYTLEEVLKLGFIENAPEWYNENKGHCDKEFEEISYNDKVKAIVEYSSDDELAGMLHFENEDDATKYKEEVIKEINEIEKEYSVYKGKFQDKYGCFRDVYVNENK